MSKKLIKLVIATVAALVAVLGFAATSAYAAEHYVKGPTVTVSGNSLVVSWKAAGLGNTVETADFALTGTVTATAQCFTKSGNPVNGVPKTDTTTVNTTGTFPVRNGQVTGSFTVSPLTTLTCTGKQEVRILSVAYDLTLTGDSLPPVHLSN
ncbi:hypothetical protein [Raineyella sp. LH-20]|uniref:hypothetical protein n=1 Tax=Raineyella sp. LH-20 TaxID=3081204 RepID=UPI00295407A5|nr:hypothetical protein [Raineyella sp. LH-20]WOP17743.1 hypothetical protein R0146_10805 [Raineyella sp. LH-20]